MENQHEQIISGQKDGWLLIEYWDGQPMYEVAYWKNGDVVDGWLGKDCFISHYDDNKLGAEEFLRQVKEENINHIERGV